MPTAVRSLTAAGGLSAPRSLAAACALAAPILAQSAGPLQLVPSARLQGSGTARFGRTLSLSGDDLLVRSAGSSTTSAPARAFVFRRSAGSWSQQAVFDIPFGSALGCTARSNDVSISGDLAVIGEPSFSIFGKAWISERSGGVWSAPFPVTDDTQNFYQFAQGVLAYAGLAFVGVPDDPFPGWIWIYRKVGAAWNLHLRFQAPGAGHHRLGAALVRSGATLLAAEDDALSVFVEATSAADWDFQALLDPPGSAYVRAIALDGDLAAAATVVNASCAPTGVTGVHVFVRSGTTWSAPQLAAPGNASALALSGDTLYAGFEDAGVVRVYQRGASGWSQIAELEAAFPSDGFFGGSLALDGTTLCVGAPGTALAAPGSVEVYDVVPLPAPATYCVAKVNSQGCTPAIAAAGVPGLTNPNAFAITASNVLNEKSGFLLYSTAGAASTPFQGGTLCLAPPLRRTPPQSSGGTAGGADCTGTYVFDFNAWARSGADPALVPGAQVWAQYYSRDPGDAFQVGLTDALAFTLGS
jgi:hypothetical protein